MDLRFKIIAEHVQAGWDKAGQSLGALKGKFADFFGGVKGGFGMMAGVVVAAVTGIYKAFEGIRQKWLEEIATMNAASIDFANQAMDNIRKVKFQDTAQEGARNADSIQKQIREKKQRFDDLQTADATESIAGSIGDWASGKWRAAKGLGDMDEDQAEMARIAEEVHFLELQLAHARKVAAKQDADEKAQAEIEAAKKVAEEKRAADKARHEQGKAWMAEEMAAVERMLAVEAENGKARLDRQQKTDAARDQIKEAARNARYDAASPEDKRKMDMQRLAELGKVYNAKNAFNEPEFAPDKRAAAAVEAIEIRARISKEDKDAFAKALDERNAKAERDNAEKTAAAEAAASARKAAAGQSLDLGQLFDRRYGQGVNEDPMLKEAKEQTNTLHQIERKLGMTA